MSVYKTCLPFVLGLCNADYPSYENIFNSDVDVMLKYKFERLFG